MAFRSLQFFMMPEEFDPLIWEIARSRQLSIVMERIGWGIPKEQTDKLERITLGTQEASIVMPDGARAERLYLTTEMPLITGLIPNNVRPAEWGWVQIDVPTVDGNVLYLADVGAKSDFYDKKTNHIFENPTSISLFTAVARVVRKRLKRPVYLYSLKPVGPHTIARGLGYTDGVAEWEDQGGVLAQRGVMNTRFSIRAEPPSNGAQPPPTHDAPSHSGPGPP